MKKCGLEGSRARFFGRERQKLLTPLDYCDSLDYIDSLGGNNEGRIN